MDVLILTFWAPWFPSGLECQPIISVPIGIRLQFFFCFFFWKWYKCDAICLGACSDDLNNLQQTSEDVFWLLKLPNGEPGSSTTQHFLQTDLFSCSGRSAIRQRLNLASTGRGGAAGRRGLVWLFLMRFNCFHPKMVLLSSSMIQPDSILEEGVSNPGAWRLLQLTF